MDSPIFRVPLANSLARGVLGTRRALSSNDRLATAATAAARQRQFEITQLNYLIEEATENVRAEVETAVRNLHATKQAATSRQLALDAANAEVDALRDRWQTLGNDPRLGQLQLNDLLSSQDRLLQEEQNLLQSLVQYNRAVLEVQRSTGR